jgi:orotate phosphoribosyltransferase-like protein
LILSQVPFYVLLKSEFASVFVPRSIKGVSSPYDWKSRQDMELELAHVNINRSPVIIFDDIATTGVTIKGCISALNTRFFIVPVVWIYGNTGGRI